MYRYQFSFQPINHNDKWVPEINVDKIQLLFNYNINNPFRDKN